MGKCAQFVIGPAGTGKTTYCRAIQEHCSVVRRTVHIVNLDPAVDGTEESDVESDEENSYFATEEPTAPSSLYSFDIQNLISVPDVMDQLRLGPNGGLIFCMEYLLKHLDWLQDQISDFSDDYLLFDCPGQIELYTHYDIFSRLMKEIERMGYRVCVVYVLDAAFLLSPSKFIAGSLACLSAMIRFEFPHISVLSKCDLVGEALVESFLQKDIDDFVDQMQSESGLSPDFQRLNRAISGLLKQFQLVSFLPLNILKKKSIQHLMSHVDMVLQFDEDQETRPRDFPT